MSTHRFFECYRKASTEEIPWYSPEPDPDLVEIFAAELPERGARVVDLGSGPGVHAIHLASSGHRVTALDVVPDARDLALELAGKAGVELDYQVVDVLGWRPAEEASFDAAIDRGFMHTLDPADRPRWQQVVCRALRPGGLLVVKCFDRYPPRDFGPQGLSALEVVETVGPTSGPLVLSRLERTRFQHIDGPHATWTVVARRQESDRPASGA